MEYNHDDDDVKNPKKEKNWKPPFGESERFGYVNFSYFRTITMYSSMERLSPIQVYLFLFLIGSSRPRNVVKMSQTKIAEQLDIKQSQVSSALARLGECGLVIYGKEGGKKGRRVIKINANILWNADARFCRPFVAEDHDQKIMDIKFKEYFLRAQSKKTQLVAKRVAQAFEEDRREINIEVERGLRGAAKRGNTEAKARLETPAFSAPPENSPRVGRRRKQSG